MHMTIIYVLFHNSCDLCIQLVTLFNLFVTYQLGTLFEDELSLDESDNEKMCMITGEHILHRSKIKADRSLLHEDLGSEDQDKDTFVDGNEDHMCSDEEVVVWSGDSDNCDSHTETDSRSSSHAGNETEQWYFI